MKACETNLTTQDGLTVYDLDPSSAELWAVAGPPGHDPAAIDTDSLPDGFRWVMAGEWAELQDEPSACGDLHDYTTGEYIREATPEEAEASREAAELDGGPGVILVGEDGQLLRSDDRGADDARRCYVQD